MTKIWIVDAFTDKPYRGNPAGVMVLDEFPLDKTCHAIAAELNHVRWFTLATEVKLCGHATLASAHVLFAEQLIQSNKIRFDSLSGVLNVTQEVDGLVNDTVMLNGTAVTIMAGEWLIHPE